MGRRTPESRTHLSRINLAVNELVADIALAIRLWSADPRSADGPLNIRLTPNITYRAIHSETHFRGIRTDRGLQAVPYVSQETFTMDCAMILEEISRQVVELVESSGVNCDGIHRHPIGSWVGSIRR